jgi:hypothetical protein
MEVHIQDVDGEVEDSMPMEVKVGRSHGPHLLPPFELDLHLPVFRASLIDEQDNHLEIDGITSSSALVRGGHKEIVRLYG